MHLSELNERFGVAGAVAFEQGPGGFARAVLTGAGGRAAVLLYGAHAMEFQPDGHRPVLWVSRRSWLEAGKPIRGGVPVCWPWFGGKGPVAGSPLHGFARLAEWTVESAARLPDGRATITLVLRSEAVRVPQAAAWWPHAFELRYTVTAGSDLTLTLSTRNTGNDPFTITQALHTYFAVSDVRSVRVHGLEGAEYIDTVGPETLRRQGPEPVAVRAEIDNVYRGHTGECVLEDAPWGRRIRVAKSGSRSTVVWNPWIEKAARMPDFGDDEWPHMLCIETANAGPDDAVTIPPAGGHDIQTHITVEPM